MADESSARAVRGRSPRTMWHAAFHAAADVLVATREQSSAVENESLATVMLG